MFWEIFIPSIALLIVLSFVVNYLIKLRYVKTIKGIAEKIKIIRPEVSIELYEREDMFQIELNEKENKTIIKLVNSRAEYEFIITNTNKWIVNSNPQQWTRKSNPVFIKGVEDFINYKHQEGSLEKIVLIYPDCKHVIRYLNESDTVILKDDDLVKGIHFVKHENLEKFLKKH